MYILIWIPASLYRWKLFILMERLPRKRAINWFHWSSNGNSNFFGSSNQLNDVLKFYHLSLFCSHKMRCLSWEVHIKLNGLYIHNISRVGISGYDVFVGFFENIRENVNLRKSCFPVLFYHTQSVEQVNCITHRKYKVNVENDTDHGFVSIIFFSKKNSVKYSNGRQ